MSEKLSVRIKRVRAELEELEGERVVAEREMKKHRDTYVALGKPIGDLQIELKRLQREKGTKQQESRAVKKLLAVYRAPEFKVVCDVLTRRGWTLSAVANDNDADGIPDSYKLTFSHGKETFVRVAVMFDRVRREVWDHMITVESSCGIGLPLQHLSSAHQDVWQRIVDHTSFPVDTTVRMSEFVVALIVQAFPWWADYCTFNFDTYVNADGMRHYCAGGGNLLVRVYPDLLAGKK